MRTILETTRMRLREFHESDLDSLGAMVADDEQMRFYPRPKTRDEASAWIGRNLSLYREHRFGFWFIESIATGEFLGYCGIRPLSVDGVNETEMGWHTRKPFWNRGLATEAAIACRDMAFTQFALRRMVGIIDPKNVASLRVAERIGMRPEREAVVDDYPCIIYAIEQSQRTTQL